MRSAPPPQPAPRRLRGPVPPSRCAPRRPTADLRPWPPRSARRIARSPAPCRAAARPRVPWVAKLPHRLSRRARRPAHSKPGPRATMHRLATSSFPLPCASGLLARGRVAKQPSSERDQARGSAQEREAGLPRPRRNPQRLRLPPFDPELGGPIRRVSPDAGQLDVRERELRLLPREDPLGEIPGEGEHPGVADRDVLLVQRRQAVLAVPGPLVIAR